MINIASGPISFSLFSLYVPMPGKINGFYNYGFSVLTGDGNLYARRAADTWGGHGV
jgi:hypothetical protein